MSLISCLLIVSLAATETQTTETENSGNAFYPEITPPVVEEATEINCEINKHKSIQH